GVAARLADTLAWGVETGRFHLEDADVAATALLGGLVALLTASTYEQRLGPGDVDAFVALALRMLGVPDDRARELLARPVPAWPGPTPRCAATCRGSRRPAQAGWSSSWAGATPSCRRSSCARASAAACRWWRCTGRCGSSRSRTPSTRSSSSGRTSPPRRPSR